MYFEDTSLKWFTIFCFIMSIPELIEYSESIYRLLAQFLGWVNLKQKLCLAYSMIFFQNSAVSTCVDCVPWQWQFCLKRKLFPWNFKSIGNLGICIGQAMKIIDDELENWAESTLYIIQKFQVLLWKIQ